MTCVNYCDVLFNYYILSFFLCPSKVLIDNGFTPEWILLQKEIREERDHIRNRLTCKRKTLGSLPLSYHEEQEWNLAVKSCEHLVKQINNKINKYNLLVPILQKQMLQVQKCNKLKEKYNPVFLLTNFCWNDK